jgi:hypothetical protein
MVEVAGSWRSLSDIATFYRELAAARDSAALLSLGALVDHLGSEYGNCLLVCWTSAFTLCISQHRWESPADWLPYLRIEPAPNDQIEFRYRDSLVCKLDWVRLVSPEGVIGRFDAFIDQLHWRPAVGSLT